MTNQRPSRMSNLKLRGVPANRTVPALTLVPMTDRQAEIRRPAKARRAV
jgi:hypothetical protein